MGAHLLQHGCKYESISIKLSGINEWQRASFFLRLNKFETSLASAFCGATLFFFGIPYYYVKVGMTAPMMI